jgi:carboxyl-terminal processing protease
MAQRRRAMVVMASLLTACSDPLADAGDAAVAREHLDVILDVMQQNSINRKQIDWTSFRASVNALAQEPRDIGDTFAAIHLALGLLGDNHSIYYGPPGWAQTISNSRVTCSAPAPLTLTVPSDIGYLQVGATVGITTMTSTYANQMHSRVRTQDLRDPVGWIVDLRGNVGGNMWPMIAGLGAILGDRTLGFFIDPDGIESTWEYEDGKSILDGRTLHTVAVPYAVNRADPKVAVIIDGRVASSAEGAAIAFMGRPNTRFFGTPSCGLSTVNSTFIIHGATLHLTVATIADRNRFAFGDTLRPDEVITDVQQLNQRVIDWLRGG